MDTNVRGLPGQDTAQQDGAWAFEQYEAIRGALPPGSPNGACLAVSSIAELAEQYDVFLLDAFGVLNIGNQVIPSAVDSVNALRDAGKRIFVLTNGASLPLPLIVDKFTRLGFDFEASQIISSRMALKAGLSSYASMRWGAMALTVSDLDDIGGNVRLLGTDPALYDGVDGFLLISTGEWTEEQQALLWDSLDRKARPVLVGNPDLVAPHEHGFTVEPGWYGHALAIELGADVRFFGKPFFNIFDLVFDRLDGEIPLERFVMVGDTLHTDILGGAAAGIGTALVSGHGLFAGLDPEPFMQRSGIRPDYILHSP